MNENQNPDAEPDTTPIDAQASAPHADRSTLRPAYAFDGSGPYLYAPDGSGPYAYTQDGHGPYLIGSPALAGTASWSHAAQHGTPYGAAHPADATGWSGAFGSRPDTSKRKRLGLMIGSGVAALAIVGAAGGTALGLSSHGTRTTSSQTQGSTTLPGSGTGTGTGTDGSGTKGFTVPGDGTGSGTGTGSTDGNGTGSGSGSTGTQSPATAATAAQKKGVVTINTVLNYDASSQAAGTGMVLTSDGTVLTNNHVIQGATSISVTDETTGKEYDAEVVGADATNDVAVLKLQDASGLSTVSLDDDGGAKTGDAVTDVGNAEGTGNLVAAAGTVTATDRTSRCRASPAPGPSP